MNIASLIKHLQLFEENRKKSVSSFPSPEKRVDYAAAIAKCFIPCAKKILAGHFEVKNKVSGVNISRKIYPTVIELYYHEEDPGGFQDPIMYHTDYRKRSDKKAKGETYFTLTELDKLPYFPIGSLNPHTSGIDVTFENAEKHYRASFLIREYNVIYENKKERTVKNSTEIYDDMLFNGITQDNAAGIEWVDDNEDIQLKKPDWRRNVPDYEKDPENPEVWIKKKASGEGTFTVGKYSYAKCPLNWQFAKE